MTLINSQELKIRLWEVLSELRPWHKRGPTRFSIRCIFCGDSIKDPTHTHFYIKADIHNDEEPVLFKCHRCEVSGLLTSGILRSLGVTDLDINSALTGFNKKSMKNSRFYLGLKHNNLNLEIPKPDLSDKKNELKMHYLNKRLGRIFTPEDVVNLKIIFRLGDFIKLNKIENINSTVDKAKQLHANYIGFLSTRNEFIDFRQVFRCEYKRYEKYAIFQNIDTTKKFYTIPTQIDLLEEKTITLNIAEGVFDILGVYYNVRNQEIENNIYIAVCGAGFLSVLKYFIAMGVIGDVNVNIFSDNDRNKYFYKKAINEIKPWVNKINLFYNEKSKDFGVPEKDISISRERI